MKNSVRIQFRYFVALLIVISLFCFSAFLEYYKHINPCPLCMMQRFMFSGLSIVFLVGMIFRLNKIMHTLLALCGLLFATGGILFAARQSWLQHIATDNMGSCGMSLSVLFKIFSPLQALQQIWQGGIECSESSWQFLHLSLADWSLIGFILFFVFIITQIKNVIK